MWDLATGQRLGQALAGHADAVRAVTSTTVDGRPVAVTGGDDATVRTWDLLTAAAL